MFHFDAIFPLFLSQKMAIFNIIVNRKGENIMQVKKQLKRGQFCLSVRDMEKLCFAADSLRDRIIIKLLCRCGLRREECAGLAVGDVGHNQSGGGAGMVRVVGKGGKERFVPLPGDIEQDINFYLGRRRSGPLFPGHDKKRSISPIQINRITGGAGMAAGVKNPHPGMKGINPHLLRHSYARRLKDAGVPLEAIAAVLGHENVNTTLATYGLLSTSEITSKVLEAVA